MKAQFLSDGSDFRARGGGGYLAKNRRDSGLFWWTIIITLLMGLATFCWFFSIMVFKYPEKPLHYKLLTRLEKLEPLERFDPLDVPSGTFHGARDLLARYYNYNPEQLRVVNDVLKRGYLLNYAEESPVYVKGTYTVVHARPLTPADIVDAGWIVRAKSVDLEDVEVELLLPGADAGQAPYQPGENFTLDNKSTYCSVINVERRLSSDGLCATVVPISYGNFTVGNQQKVSLTPPTKLNMEAPLPVLVLDAPETPAAAKVSQVGGF